MGIYGTHHFAATLRKLEERIATSERAIERFETRLQELAHELNDLQELQLRQRQEEEHAPPSCCIQ